MEVSVLMQIRQVLTNHDFLSALNTARTDTARVEELNRLEEYEKNLIANMKKWNETESFDINFVPVRMFHESQYVIHCLAQLVEKAKSNTTTNEELDAALRAFFKAHAERMAKSRADYFPYIPTDSSSLMWQLAQLLSPVWNEPAAKILIPTLRHTTYNNYNTMTEVLPDSDIILNDSREYPISLTTFLNRLARDQGLTYYHAINRVNVALSVDEKIRLTTAFASYENPLDLRAATANNHEVLRMLKSLRHLTVDLLKNDEAVHAKYYDADKECYSEILRESWLLKNPKLLFEFMGYVPSCEWDEYVKTIFLQKEFAAVMKDSPLNAPYAVKEGSYYTKDHAHNAAVLYFFAELKLHKREGGYEYNSVVPRMVSYASKTMASKLAYSKEDKEKAIIVLLSYLISGEPLSKNSMRAYFIKEGHEALLGPLCEARSETNAIVEQIEILGQANTNTLAVGAVIKQGLFAGQPKQDAKQNIKEEVDQKNAKVVVSPNV